MNERLPCTDFVNKNSQLPSVAVVILNWNGKSYLEKFLPSVVASTYKNTRIIVVDNASTDTSVLFLKEHYPKIERIINPVNEGFAKGYNSALKKVEADYYVLLNSDVEVTAGWIEPMIKLMEQYPNIAACQPKVLSFGNKQQFEYAGAAGGWMDCLGYPFARGRVLDYCEEDLGQYDNASPCSWASGAALFVKAKLYHQAGGLDEYFFAHQEEIDFCWRLQLNGYDVYCEPLSIVYHVGGGSLPKTSKTKTYLNFRNNLIMLYKNMAFKEKIWKLPLRLFLDIAAGAKHLFAGEAGHFVAIGKAWLHFIRWIILHQHRSLFPNKIIQKKDGRFPGSIIWDYYVKKKRRFSEIVGDK
ncbi:MAG: glycosyltransferase family 2 protein [Ferruginibacter sp.]